MQQALSFFLTLSAARGKDCEGEDIWEEPFFLFSPSLCFFLIQGF